MQLWFAHGTGITLREQLVTQVILGILCGDLVPGQRLPSTRELARRYHLHPNTVSAGFRQLARERWVEFRRGSGVYVRDTKPDVPPSSALALDQLVGNLFRSARMLRAPLAVVRSRLRHWLDLQPPDHFVLIEPDEELRRILTAEIKQAVTFPVIGCALPDASIAEAADGGIGVALPNREKAARQALPLGTELLTLRIRSVPSSLAEWLPARMGLLVGVASAWPEFLKSARTMLTAAGFHPDSLVFRDARKPKWKRGLQQTAAVVCDSVTATSLRKLVRVVPFKLLSESSLAELKDYEDFIRSPLRPSV